MYTPQVESLTYIDDCCDGDKVQDWYRVRESNVLVHTIELNGPYGIPMGHDLELVTSGGQWLQGPTYALKADIIGRARDAHSARYIADWIRRNVKELDE